MKKTRTRKLRVQREFEASELVPVASLPARERRFETRYAARQHVAIRFRNTTLICDLSDLSETGAKICVLDGIVPNISDKLVLTLFDGTTVDGQVTWLRDKHIGVDFVNPIKGVDERLDFEDLGRAFFGKAVTLQKLLRRG